MGDFAGKLGEPVESVWRDHSYASTNRGLKVANLPRDRYDDVWANWDIPAAVAFEALHTLTELTRPRPPLAIGNGRLPTFVETESRRWKAWPTDTLMLHGAPAQCPTARFAGSWVALVNEDPHSRLIFVGRGQDPAAVSLTRVTSDAYGFGADDDTPRGTHGPAGSENTWATSSTPQPHPDWTPFVD